MILPKKDRNTLVTTIKFEKKRMHMKNNYKIVTINDDELAVDNLAFELKSYQQFNVEGIAKNGAMGKIDFQNDAESGISRCRASRYAGPRTTELGPQRDHVEHASRLLYGLQ